MQPILELCGPCSAEEAPGVSVCVGWGYTHPGKAGKPGWTAGCHT